VIGASCERLDAGAKSKPIRETASSVYHVIEGAGETTIDGKPYSWKQGDTFCIPAWKEYQHSVPGTDRAFLYRFDDKPMLKSLGFYRVDGIDVETLVSD
jgi:gentisate 1,2-dioxygenase